ncbi:hypothetical protein [Glycomyces dulcitolivorans]|uniref:hypothetical protein n=1 Tax=Glycomyces dulcitolivorans TaxID=2200759 RepID=UPI001300628B|nr:hypothetical protein [Glycomyces dulcitolivorans]
MTESAIDLIINLIAAAIAFSVGFSVRRLRFRFDTRDRRKFWIALGAVELHIIVGHGDLEAFAQLRNHLHQIDIRDFGLSASDRATAETLKKNLILIGGPESNIVSARVLEKISSTFRFGSAQGSTRMEAAIQDSQLDTTTACRTNLSGNVTKDHGIFIRCTNPFEQQRKVVFMAGCLGYATIGAIRLIETADFIDHPVIASGQDFEAMYSCDVSDGVVTGVQLGIVRRLSI